jgi:GT2 family glycosyltransferase/glycosyltransferase involved in cell wall biosynthesis
VVLAREAHRCGFEALRANDRALAIQWFERAHRLVPSAPLITLTLATVFLGYDDRRAQALFREIATNVDLREAWIGLSTACLRLGDRAGAASSIGHALRAHALQETAQSAAEAVVRDLGLEGWCGLLGSGRLVVGSDGDVQISVDGRVVTRPPTRVKWAKTRQISVTAHGRHLLGSPLDVAAIARTVGYIERVDSVVQGWAMHPSDPGTKPILTLCDGSGRVVGRIACMTEEVSIAGQPDGTAPWGFRLDVARLGEVVEPLRVIGRDGVDLLGSPVSSAAMTVAFPASSAKRATDPRAIAVIIPALRDRASASGYAEAVAGADAATDRVLVVTTDLDIVASIEPVGGVELVPYAGPQGFAAAANAGIAASGECDVVLLRPGVTLPPGWLESLASAALKSPDIGTVMAFSVDSGGGTHKGTAIQLDHQAVSETDSDAISVPYGEDYCLYIKRACLDEVGSFDVTAFAQDFGAVADFCLRARRFGWRHVATPNVVVAGRGHADWGPAGESLKRRNLLILRQRYPDFRDLDDAFSTDVHLVEAQRKIESARWKAGSAPGERAIVLIAHADGGGVSQRVGAAAQKYRDSGFRAIILSPTAVPGGGVATSVDGHRHLRFALPDEMPALTRFLRGTHPALVEVHHTLGHDPSIYDAVHGLSVPYEVHIHDYAWVCPRIALINQENRYCGEPDLAGCERCVALNGNLIGEDIAVAALRQRSAAFLAAARRVIAPSTDTAIRMRRYFPNLAVTVVPHENDTRVLARQASRGTGRICVLGGIGPHKGFDVLLACARDAATRGLALEFVVVGDTVNDRELLDTGHAMITETYAPAEAVDLGPVDIHREAITALAR